MPLGGLGISLVDSLFLFPISLPHPPPLLQGTGVSELGLEAEPERWPRQLALGEWDLVVPPPNPRGPHLPSVSPSCSLTLKEFTKGGPGCLVTGRPLMVSSGC